jgi:hypothetical protein
MQLDSLLEVSETLSNVNISNFDHSRVLPRHRWYDFKEGFSPLLVEAAIQAAELRPMDIVVDPFVGSGTVPLVASMGGYHSVGFEVNPFISLIGRSKQSRVSPSTFRYYRSRLIASMQLGSHSKLEGFSTFTDNGANEKWLFNLEVLRSFTGGWKEVESLPSEVSLLYKVALISAAMSNANAVKDGKCLRYRRDWRGDSFSGESLLVAFLKNCEMIEDDLEGVRLDVSANLIDGDVRCNLDRLGSGQFKLCVTSPPYLNSFDYSDIYRPELFLCGFVKNNQELTQLRKRTIRSHVQTTWELPHGRNYGDLYLDCISDIVSRRELLWSPRIPEMIQAYFEDIEMILLDLKRFAQRDAVLWLVVSTSSYAGIEIPVDVIIGEIGARVGWRIERIVVTRQLRNSTQNAAKWNAGESNSRRLRESIVMFRGIE